MKVLMVCLGNICRSPLAEGILREKIESKNLQWEVDSAGTGSWHVGNPPDPRSILIASKHNIDISNLMARQFTPADLDTFDLILAMDTSNYDTIIKNASPDQKKKVHLIMDFHPTAEENSVPDPFYDNDGFAKIYEMLTHAIDGLVQQFNR